MNITFKKATPEDIPLVIALQNSAFQQDYVRYGSCPSYNRPKEQMKHIIHNQYDFIIMADEVPVGNFIAKLRNKNECHLNSLGIIPAYQGKGIGTAAMNFIECYFDHCSVVTLDTPADKNANIRFYKRRGFHIMGEDNSGGIPCVLFQKKIKRAEKAGYLGR